MNYFQLAISFDALWRLIRVEIKILHAGQYRIFFITIIRSGVIFIAFKLFSMVNVQLQQY